MNLKLDQPDFLFKMKKKKPIVPSQKRIKRKYTFKICKIKICN